MVLDEQPLGSGHGDRGSPPAGEDRQKQEGRSFAQADGPGRTRKEVPLGWLVVSRVIIPGILIVGAGLGLVRLRSLITPDVKVGEVVAQLREGGSARWKAVAYITPFLYDQRYKDLRSDPALAAALSETLAQELESPLAGYADFSIAARAHLCRLLRCMETPVVIPSLAKAVRWRGGPSPQMDSPVRRAAAESLYELGDRLGSHVLRDNPEVLPALLQAAGDPVDPVRAAAALALGLHGGDEACQKLAGLLGDPNPAIRYNAAIGLALAGDAAGMDILEELFQSKETQTLAETGNLESINAMRTRRLLVLGLRSLDRLIDMDPTAPVEDLRPSLNRLQYSLVPEDVKQLALQVEVKINQRAVR